MTTPQTIKISIIFAVAFGAVSLIETQVITMDRYLLNIFFLVSTAAFLIVHFKERFLALISNTRWYEFATLLLISLVIHAVTSYLILHFFSQVTFPFDSRGTSFLLMNSYYLWAKPFDILVQQLLIVLLVGWLSKNNMSLKRIMLIFVVFFGSIHIFQTLKTDLIIGLGFTLFAILGALIFPYMILRVRNGYIYNFMIHLGIYNLAAILTRLMY